MSDIASPILAVMDNEAHAFICFCGIMKRLEGNFRPDGQLMSVKFQHLKLLLQYSDPEFYSYLVSRGADDLFFCYRWLLLELKREFAFDDALRMLEVTWSSLPPDPPETEVELLGPPLEADDAVGCRDKTAENCLRDETEQKEKQRRRHMLRPSREEPDASRSVLVEGARKGTSPFERQSSFGDFKYYTARSGDSFDMEDAEQPRGPAAPSARRQSTLDSEDDPGERTPLIKNASSPACPGGLPMWKPSSRPGDSPSLSTATGGEAPAALPTSGSPTSCAGRTAVASPSHTRSLLSSPILSFGRGSSLSGGRSCSSNLPSPGNKSPSATADAPGVKQCSLPPPQEFGKGNPFMLFLCLSILLEHREHIIKNSLDYNEMAMHFDRLVRRHNLSRVLQRAKALFADYLQSEVWDSEEGDEVSSDSPTPASAAQRSPSPPASVGPLYSPLASPPNSTYNLATTVPSPTAAASLLPTS